MKAEFKRTRTTDGLPLTFGKKYDVLEIKTEKRPWVIKEVKVKNDLGQEQWYKASKFKLLAEAAKFLNEPAAAGAGKSAGRSATPDGKQIYMGINTPGGVDMKVCGKSLEMADIERVTAAALKIGETVETGIAAGMGLHYGA